MISHNVGVKQTLTPLILTVPEIYNKDRQRYPASSWELFIAGVSVWKRPPLLIWLERITKSAPLCPNIGSTSVEDAFLHTYQLQRSFIIWYGTPFEISIYPALDSD